MLYVQLSQRCFICAQSSAPSVRSPVQFTACSVSSARCSVLRCPVLGVSVKVSSTRCLSLHYSVPVLGASSPWPVLGVQSRSNYINRAPWPGGNRTILHKNQDFVEQVLIHFHFLALLWHGSSSIQLFNYSYLVSFRVPVFNGDRASRGVIR